MNVRRDNQRSARNRVLVAVGALVLAQAAATWFLDDAFLRVAVTTDVENKLDERNPPVRHEDVYSLTVTTQSSKVNLEPLTRTLPPFYVPQALAHVLPRLVPLNEPKGYMFASFVSETREVMSRYLDIGREQNVTLDGKKMTAIPVKERIGLEGSVTTHWMSPDGKYLGSVNEDSKVTILPSDEATLRKIWVDAKLTAPAPAPAKG